MRVGAIEFKRLLRPWDLENQDQDGSIFLHCSKSTQWFALNKLLIVLQNKIKVQLKLSISRLRMVQQKDTAIAKQQRRAMAVLLEVLCLAPPIQQNFADLPRSKERKNQLASE